MTGLRSLVLLAIFAGCGSQTNHANVHVDKKSNPAMVGEIIPVKKAKADAGPQLTVVEKSPPNCIRRSDLDAVLALGPAALLRRVDTEPVRERKRFVGFRITGFPLGPPKAIDLRIGDILLAVNGTPVERPEHFVQIITELKSAHQLLFEISREGEHRVLDYTIVQ